MSTHVTFHLFSLLTAVLGDGWQSLRIEGWPLSTTTSASLSSAWDTFLDESSPLTLEISCGIELKVSLEVLCLTLYSLVSVSSPLLYQFSTSCLGVNYVCTS